MLSKFLSLLLIGLLFSAVAVNHTYAESKTSKEARLIEKVKEGIRNLGTGENARVEVKLKDKSKLRGYISEANDEGFSVIDSKTGATTRVLFPNVRQVQGNNLSTGAKIAIGLGILAGVLAFWLFLENYG